MTQATDTDMRELKDLIQGSVKSNLQKWVDPRADRPRGWERAEKFY
jgi:hypothetical protein